MPITSDRHAHARSPMYLRTARVLHVLQQRLRRANLPLMVAFFSALVMFLRALSGAGYVDPYSQALPPSSLNYSHLATDSSSLNAHGYGSFAEHWARFKEAFLSCPDADDGSYADIPGTAGGTLDSDTGTLRDSDREATNSPGPSSSSTRVGVGCLKERLSGMMGGLSHRPNSNAPGPAKVVRVKQDDRAFGISLDGISHGGRRKGDTQDLNSDPP